MPSRLILTVVTSSLPLSEVKDGATMLPAILEGCYFKSFSFIAGTHTIKFIFVKEKDNWYISLDNAQKVELTLDTYEIDISRYAVCVGDKCLVWPGHM